MEGRLGGGGRGAASPVPGVELVDDVGGGPAGNFEDGGGGVGLVKEGRLTAAAKTPVAVAGVVAVVAVALEAIFTPGKWFRFGRELAAPNGACCVSDPMSLRTIQAVSGRSLK